MLTRLVKLDTSALYQMDASSKIKAMVATTPETREICNDPTVAGVQYTNKLKAACTKIFQMGQKEFDLKEDETVVINILRGGLNFGLREALADSYGWNRHTTCFISAQRARNASNSEEWHITENAYRKIYFPKTVSLVIGDVVATGTSLRYALSELLNTAQAANVSIRNILFFTYGGNAALRILEAVDAECRQRFPGYQQTSLVFLEGCFAVPDLSSTLSIRLTGTDLIRVGSIMAPEFIESQYESPTYPIERCIIYDAGSRAFWVREFAADVCIYWKQVLNLAEHGLSYADYLRERFPELDCSRFGEQSLRDLAMAQLRKMKPFIP